MKNGWISIYRQIIDNEFYFAERFTKMQAWIDLLLLANHKPQTIYIRGIEIKLNIGELAYSIESLSERWKWNQRTVIKFFNTLSNRQMIHTRITNVTTIITIRKYSDYQNSTDQSTEQNAERVQTRVQTDNNINNDNNNKSIKQRKFVPPTIDDIKKYIIENNYSVDPNIFLKYFTESNWIDSNGKKVKNWKQKIITWEGRNSKKKLLSAVNLSENFVENFFKGIGNENDKGNNG